MRRCVGLLSLALLLPPSAPATAQRTSAADLPPPSVLWLSSEDNGPHLGAYGDAYATTPHLDGLAARGLIYRNAWSTAPVCAPARTPIISGLYPASTGAHHMRSQSQLPEGFRFFPQFLREAGYYTTNNSREDYNLAKPGGQGAVWHESSREAHWRNRPDGTSFFAVFNFTVSHESQIRRRPHTPVHDPAAVRVPAYHPDVPEVRQDWAQYYDKLTEMDAMAGERLAEPLRPTMRPNGSGWPRRCTATFCQSTTSGSCPRPRCTVGRRPWAERHGPTAGAATRWSACSPRRNSPPIGRRGERRPSSV